MTQREPTFREDQDTAADSLHGTGCVLKSVALMALLVLLGAMASQLGSRSLRISTETTFVTEPRTPDGKRIDYFAAIEEMLHAPDMKTDDNGYRLLVRELGPAASYRYEVADEAADRQVSEKLGLDPDEPPKRTYESPDDFLQRLAFERRLDRERVDAAIAEDKAERKAAFAAMTSEKDAWLEQVIADGERATKAPLAGLGEHMVGGFQPTTEWLEGRYRRPWSLDDCPWMGEWLETNGPALDVVAEAVRKPAFRTPLVLKTKGAVLREKICYSEVARGRGLANGLAARANHRIATGDIDGAIDDIITCKRLGRHLGNQGGLVSSLLGMACEEAAASIDIAGDANHPPTEEQLRRLMDELDRLPPRDCVSGTVALERLLTLETIQALAWGEHEIDANAWGFDESRKKALGHGVDWSIVAQRVNAYYDFASGTGPYVEPWESTFWLTLIRPRSEYVGDFLAGQYEPAMQAFRHAVHRAECADHLQHIALAMLLYERDHGTLPPAYTIDEEGKPLHSWRVLLLPYLGEQALYDRIKLDEPWDSPHNGKQHAATPSIYQCLDAVLEPGDTTYAVIVGERCAFEGGEGRTLESLDPRSERMILVTECEAPDCWMDATFDIPYDTAREGVNKYPRWSTPPPCPRTIGSQHGGGVNVGLRSGAVELLPEMIETAYELRARIEGKGDFDR